MSSIQSALEGDDRQNLLDALDSALEGHKVEQYQPQERIESDVEEVLILSSSMRPEVRLREVIETEGNAHTCHLEADMEADLQWSSSAPTPFDADHFAGLTLNENSGAPILQGYESAVPLVADFVATWAPGQGWHDVEVNALRLEDTEARKRAERMSVAEETVLDAEYGDGE